MILSGREPEKLVVSVILLDSDGRILLQQRDDQPEKYPNWWTIFGGYVETDETAYEAIQRELREELDLELPLTYWKAYLCPVRTIPGALVTTNHVFVGTLDRPVAALTLREGQGMRLYPPDEAAALELAFAQHLIIRDYVAETQGKENGLRFLLYPPYQVEVGVTYPLVIFLHGSGERGDHLELVTKHGITQFMKSGGQLPEAAFVLAPQCPTDYRWGYLLDRLETLLDSITDAHPIDLDRVYLTGFSMGSFGAWQWANQRTVRFAALLTVAGNGYRSRTGEYFIDLCTVARIPLWMVHSAVDEIVPSRGADDYYVGLIACGVTFGYTRYPDADHVETARRAYSDTTLYTWMFNQRRDR